MSTHFYDWLPDVYDAQVRAFLIRRFILQDSKIDLMNSPFNNTVDGQWKFETESHEKGRISAGCHG